MTALQSIIKEAKSLRAKYPKRFSKWTDYVKQASAIYSAKHKGKSPVGKKKVVKKKVAKKSIAKKPTEKVILKKVHSAKATSKNLFNKLDKLDEAQHKHMFGKIGNINKDIIKKLKILSYDIERNDKNILVCKTNIKDKTNDSIIINYFKIQLKRFIRYNKELKTQKAELKKLL